jgi:hypothetical protein
VAKTNNGGLFSPKRAERLPSPAEPRVGMQGSTKHFAHEKGATPQGAAPLFEQQVKSAVASPISRGGPERPPS